MLRQRDNDKINLGNMSRVTFCSENVPVTNGTINFRFAWKPQYGYYLAIYVRTNQNDTSPDVFIVNCQNYTSIKSIFNATKNIKLDD